MTSTSGGSCGTRRVARGGSWNAMRATICGTFSPCQAGCPVSISKQSVPSENRSLRASTTAPVTCSGDMYAGVPQVSDAPVSAADDVRAMPKSRILGSPDGQEHHVRGLDVAVDDALCVRMREGLGEPGGDAQGLAPVRDAGRSR